MKRDEAIELSEQALEELAEQLAKGKTEELASYLSVMGKFHNYSWGNIFLIARQRPDATLVAGFRTWQTQHNRHVKKGEKGICILAPLVGKKEADDGSGETRDIFGFKAVHVFDVSQTEGEPLPEPNCVSGDPGRLLAKLWALAHKLGIAVSYSQALGSATGRSRGGAVELAPDLGAAEEFLVLAHELAHERMHWGPDRKQYPRAVRELEAEGVAYVIAKAIGLSNTLKSTADYLAGYGIDKTQLAASFARIQRTASKILGELQGPLLEQLLPIPVPGGLAAAA